LKLHICKFLADLRLLSRSISRLVKMSGIFAASLWTIGQAGIEPPDELCRPFDHALTPEGIAFVFPKAA
jgi:hypothetical protein